MTHDLLEIVRILALCSRRTGASMRELMDVTERSRATIKRMVRTLREVGVVIVCDRHEGFRYHVREWGIFDALRVRQCDGQHESAWRRQPSRREYDDPYAAAIEAGENPFCP